MFWDQFTNWNTSLFFDLIQSIDFFFVVYRFFSLQFKLKLIFDQKKIDKNDFHRNIWMRVCIMSKSVENPMNRKYWNAILVICSTCEKSFSSSFSSMPNFSLSLSLSTNSNLIHWMQFSPVQKHFLIFTQPQGISGIFDRFSDWMESR